MGPSHLPSPAVVVGVDGSRSAVSAALWAVDEAVSRDIPLRLVCAIEGEDPCPSTATVARGRASAQTAIRAAQTAVESTDQPVKVEAEMIWGDPVQTLREQSRSAAMLCLGSLGVRRSGGRRIGSTATAVADSAHCPVAVIREYDRSPATPGWIVAEIDDSPDCHCVLDHAVAEALLRTAPLRVLTAWRARFTDMSGCQAIADNNRQIRAHHERLLSPYRTSHPELDARGVAVHGSTESYLGRNAESIGLLVIGHRRSAGLAKLLALGHSALHEGTCSVLVCPASSGL